MIQHIFKITALLFTLSFITSCDFEEKNISPNSSSTIEPGPLLTYTQLNTSNEGLAKRTQVGYCMMMVQQTASLDLNEMAGDKYLETETLGIFFTTMYSTVIKNLQELIYLVENDETKINTYAVALIWKSYLFHRITDLYGDVPYSEAGNGYRTQNFYPRYDRQSDIYAGMISDIEKGLSLFNEAKDPVEGDVLYGGDIVKWKRFGNSLLLRLGMRMEKADPTRARSLITKAIQEGVMQSADDICMIQPVEGKAATENQLGYVFKSHGLLVSGAIKISKTFIDRLKSTNDPRMQVYCALPNGDMAWDKQKGLPNGYDVLTIGSGDPGYTSLTDYSTFNPATLLLLNAPTIYMVHAEVELLQAEAIVKGYIPGDAKSHYENAVRSSMQQQAIYGNAGVIPEQQIEDYLSQGLFDKATTTDEKLNVIGTEFWVATFLNGYESYANWRRTGYPALTPANYQSSPNQGKIPRRFRYPTEEYSINPDNVTEAINHQGEDKMSTAIWWDK